LRLEAVLEQPVGFPKLRPALVFGGAVSPRGVLQLKDWKFNFYSDVVINYKFE
jgi:hypothetical protein